MLARVAAAATGAATPSTHLVISGMPLSVMDTHSGGFRHNLVIRPRARTTNSPRCIPRCVMPMPQAIPSSISEFLVGMMLYTVPVAVLGRGHFTLTAGNFTLTAPF